MLLAVDAQPATYQPPMLTDGTPDLRGIWQTRSTAYLNIEGHAGGKGVPASASIIVEPASGKIPYLAEALVKRAENFKQRLRADPALKCYQAGVPRATYQPMPFQIVQSPGNLAFVYQENHAFRVIYPDTRPHFDGIDWWMGDSRSHWQGNTLVVDVTALNDHTWLDAAGNHHTNAMHVVERYTRTGANTLIYEAGIEDASVYAQPWTIRETLYRNARPGARIVEDECLDDEHGGFTRIAPTDEKSLLRNNLRRWQLPASLFKFVVRPEHSDAALTRPGDASAAAVPAPKKPAAILTVDKAAVPRLPNGRPNFQGNWYRVSNVQPTGGLFAARPPAPSDVAKLPADEVFFLQGVEIPYLPEAKLERKWRNRNKYLDGEPRCHLAGVPRAAQQPPYPHLIIQDENFITILYEYVHEPRIIPLDNSAHPKNYWAWDGDSRAHWEGDTLVIDVRNFNGRTWLDMDGNFVDENLQVVERYTLKNADTYFYEVTLIDPTVFSRPWQFSFDVKRQDRDQLLEYSCREGESDRENYAEEVGGVQKNGKAPVPDADLVRGCLRGELNDDRIVYSLETARQRVSISIDAALLKTLPEMIDRSVRLHGKWQGGPVGKGSFTADAARVLAEGCSSLGY